MTHLPDRPVLHAGHWCAHAAVAERLEWARPAGVPAIRQGWTASGGLAWFFRRLRDGTSPVSI